MKRGSTHFRLAESAWGVGFSYICILLARPNPPPSRQLELSVQYSTGETSDQHGSLTVLL